MGRHQPRVLDQGFGGREEGEVADLAGDGRAEPDPDALYLGELEGAVAQGRGFTRLDLRDRRVDQPAPLDELPYRDLGVPSGLLDSAPSSSGNVTSRLLTMRL